MIAAAYGRKSKKDEASTEAQLAECRAYAQREGLSLDYPHQDDGQSGTEFEKRPGLMKLVSYLPKPPFQVLLVTDRDRLGREQIETSYWVKKFLQAGVQIIEVRTGRHVVLGSPVDKVVDAVTNMASELEAVKAGTRTSTRMFEKAARGEVTGGIVFGYTNREVLKADGKKRDHCEYQIHPEQAAVVIRIFEMVRDGLGFKRIAHALNADQVIAPRPAKNARTPGWCPSTVRAVLHRRLYIGELIYGKSIKRNEFRQKQSAHRKEAQRAQDDWIRKGMPHLRIVPQTLWDAAHERLTHTRRAYLRSTQGRLEGRPIAGTAAKYLLTGLAQCSCGGTMSARVKFTGKHRQMYYECMTHRQKGVTVCPNKLQVKQADADALILWMLEERILNPAVFRALVQGRLAQLRPDPAVHAAERAHLRQSLSQLQIQIANLTQAIAQGGDLPGLLSALKAVEAQRAHGETALTQLDQVAQLAQLDLPQLESQVKDQVQRWRSALRQSPDAARSVARKLLTGRLTFTPGRDAAGPFYRVTGQGKLDGLVLPALNPRGYSFTQSATGVVAPTGFEPVFAVRHALS